MSSLKPKWYTVEGAAAALGYSVDEVKSFVDCKMLRIQARFCDDGQDGSFWADRGEMVHFADGVIAETPIDNCELLGKAMADFTENVALKHDLAATLKAMSDEEVQARLNNLYVSGRVKFPSLDA